MLNDIAVEVGKINDNDGHYGTVSIHVLEINNEHEERLFQFCAEQQHVLENLGQQHKPYTWRSCDGHYHNQMDYILLVIQNYQL